MLSLKLHYLMVDILVLHKYNERVDFVVVVVVIFCFSTKQICSIHILKITTYNYIILQPNQLMLIHISFIFGVDHLSKGLDVVLLDVIDIGLRINHDYPGVIYIFRQNYKYRAY